MRTLRLGHQFTQGTADSNEVWVDAQAVSGGRVGRPQRRPRARTGEVDPWAHFINVYMLDRDGNRIDRRNPQDIFTPLYNNQIPPGAAQVVHYEFTVPPDLTRAADVRGQAPVPQVRHDLPQLRFGQGLDQRPAVPAHQRPPHRDHRARTR